MADFKLDPVTGDLDITTGLQLITSYEDEAAQRLKLAWGLNLGEFFANVNSGLPYIRIEGEDFAGNIRYMLGDKFPDSPRFVYNTLTEYTKNLSFVKSISASYTFDHKTRTFKYDGNIVLDDEQEIVFPSFETVV